MKKISNLLFSMVLLSIQWNNAYSQRDVESIGEDKILNTTSSRQVNQLSGLSSADPIHRLQNALLSVTINDNISPVVASRIFVYPNLAFLNGIHESGNIPVDLKANAGSIQPFSLTATYAFVFVARSMIYSRNIFEDSVSNILHWYDQFGLSDAQKKKSEAEGLQIAKAVMLRMNQDGFRETRGMTKYDEIHEENKWRPTAPGYFQAVEPNWGKIKPIVVRDLKFPLVNAAEYDTSENSFLYQEALEVYRISASGSQEQKDIAGFWDCNPFALHVYGHRMEAEKKMSPVGHWICIAQKVSKQKNLDVVAAAKVYTSLSAGMFDALIYCWEMKYRFKFIRPEHFITTRIDPGWEPLLQSPPFPEFPSGHSVLSAAAAVLLTNEFGATEYTDDTEINFGIKPRKFKSFFQAADEAAISRVYGGIHFRHAAVEGKKIGVMIGEYFLKRLEQNSITHKDF